MRSRKPSRIVFRLEGRSNGESKIRGTHRLVQQPGCAQPHQVTRQTAFAAGGHDDDGNLSGPLGGFHEQCNSINSRQIQVEQQNVRGFGLENLQDRLAIGGFRHQMPIKLQGNACRISRKAIILGDQHAGRSNRALFKWDQ